MSACLCQGPVLHPFGIAVPEGEDDPRRGPALADILDHVGQHGVVGGELEVDLLVVIEPILDLLELVVSVAVGADLDLAVGLLHLEVRCLDGVALYPGGGYEVL